MSPPGRLDARRVSGVTAQQWRRIEELLQAVDSNLQPHQLVTAAGVSYGSALAILACLGQEGLADNQLVVYHLACSESPVEFLPFGAGFPTLPWHCPNCEELVEQLEDLTFDVQAHVSVAVRIDGSDS